MYTLCSTLRRSAIYLMVLCLISSSVSVARGDGPQVQSLEDVNKLPDCKRAGWQQPCKITVDRVRTSAVGTFVVASGTAVHLLVFKTPFEKVKFDPERKEVAANPDPLADLIKLIASSAASITFAFDAHDPDKTHTTAVMPNELDGHVEFPDEKLIADALDLIEAAEQKKSTEIKGIPGTKGVQEEYNGLTRELSEFFNKDYCTVGTLTVSRDFEPGRDNLSRSITELVETKPPLSTAAEEFLLKTIADMLKEALSRRPPTPFIKDAFRRFDEANRVLRLLQSAIAGLDDARKNFATIGKTLEQLKGAQCYQVIDLVADRQADLSGNIVFTNLVTGQDDSRKLFAKVSYRDLPRASMSTGVLLSALEKRKFSVSQKSDGPGDNPTDNVKSHTEIGAETSRPQVIPFSFINVRLAYWRIGSRMFTFNFAPGVGINPNGGTTETEFAFGPSLGVGNLYLFAGAHFARDPQLAGGFSVGDRVPKDFSIPVVRSWKTTFGFGVSYRLPLP